MLVDMPLGRELINITSFTLVIFGDRVAILGSAEEASTVFGESAVHTIQKQQHALISQNFVASTEDQNQVSAKSLGDASPRQLKSIHGNSAKDASGSYPGATASSAAVNQPLNCVSSSLSFYSTPSPMASQVRYVRLFLFPLRALFYLRE